MIYKYYFHDCCNWLYFYPYYVSPFVSDIYSYFKVNKNEMLNCFYEIRARNGFCIVITDIENLEIENNKNIIIFNTETSDYIEILFIIFFQYLALQLSILKGINPDKPRNLAKVVTVQ